MPAFQRCQAHRFCGTNEQNRCTDQPKSGCDLNKTFAEPDFAGRDYLGEAASLGEGL